MASSLRPDLILARLDRIPVWPYPRSFLWILGMGYFFAFFDIVNIGAALTTIASQLHVSVAVASWAVTASLIAYIIGAYLDGTVSDRWGRKISIIISVILFSCGSVGAALSSTLVGLTVWRFVAGLGIGAEIASVTAYLGEMAPAPVRGRYTSWATTFAYAGFVVVPGIARLLVPAFAAGWRVLFLLGAAGALTVLFLRRHLPETPRWLVLRGRLREADAIVTGAEACARQRLGRALPDHAPVRSAALAPSHPTRALLRPPYRRRVVLLIALWLVYYVGNYGWLEMAPTLLERAGYSLARSLGYLVVTSLGFLVGAALSAVLTDRYERKYTCLVVAAVWSAALFVIGLDPRPAIIMTGGLIASTTIGLLVPILYTLTAEHFSTAARATGVALSDGLGHIGGAIAPPLVLLAASRWGFSGGMAVMGISGILVVCLLPWTIKATGAPVVT